MSPYLYLSIYVSITKSNNLSLYLSLSILAPYIYLSIYASLFFLLAIFNSSFFMQEISSIMSAPKLLELSIANHVISQDMTILDVPTSLNGSKNQFNYQ